MTSFCQHIMSFVTKSACQGEILQLNPIGIYRYSVNAATPNVFFLKSSTLVNSLASQKYKGFCPHAHYYK